MSSGGPNTSNLVRDKHLTTLTAAFATQPFRTDQAAGVGVGRRRLSLLVQEGLLRPILQGVYQASEGTLDLPARLRAATLVLPPGGTIARRTAAWVWGVDPRAPDERDLILPTECLVPRPTTAVRRPSLRCFVSEIEESDVVWIENVPCTSPARTTADVLRWLPPHMGLAVADALAAYGLVSTADTQAVLARWTGRRFVRQARQLADWMEPLTESFGESWLRLRILQAGFPRPHAQIRVPSPERSDGYRLDLGWVERRIGIEYDGREFHSSDEALRADEERRRFLRTRHGWNVIGVGIGEVLGRSLRLEKGVGELLGLEPTTLRRTW